MPSYTAHLLTPEIIKSRLARALQPTTDSPYPPGLIKSNPRPAAVLIPMFRQAQDWHLLYIRRTASQHDPHSGQVAFPGGASDAGDHDATATALREAQEEIGLVPGDVTLLGRLNDFITITSYRVTPIIGQIPWPYPFRLATSEVSRAFSIPLEWLADPANYQIVVRELPSPHDPLGVIYYQPYDGEVLWGASARFTCGLLQALFDMPETKQGAP